MLPKFVQKTNPEPTPKEDLLAALAVVGTEAGTREAPEKPTEAAPEEPPALPEELADPRFDAFKAALAKQDFAAASQEVAALSGSLDAPTLGALTRTMEQAVQALEKKPAPEPQVTAAASPPGEPPPDLAASPAAMPEPAPAPASWDAGPFFAKLGGKDFAGAEAELAMARESLPSAMHAGLAAQLGSAREMARQLESSQRELEESRRRTTEIQESSVARLESSVQELGKATAAAQLAAEEARKLRDEMTQLREAGPPAPAPGSSPASPPSGTVNESTAPLELPETVAITFGFDSSLLSKEQKARLSRVVESLAGEPRLAVQLRGHADRSGNAAYNAMLAQARAESIKDALLGSGIAGTRLSVLSFGASQAAVPGTKAEELRKVEIVFRKAD